MAKPSARPVRKQDIHFRRSLFRFTLTFVFVFVLGLLSRVLLQNYPLKEKLIEKIDWPAKYDLKIDQVDWSFRSGLTPVVGITINRIDLSEKKCAFRKLSGQDLLFRLDPWRLLTGQLQLGHVEVDYLEVSTTANCESEENELSAVSASEPPDRKGDSGTSTKPALVRRHRFAKNIFNQVEILKNKKPLKKMSIRNFLVNFQEASGVSWSFEGQAKADFDNELIADLSISKVRYGEKDLSSFKSKWKAIFNSELIHLRAETSVREGDVLTQLRVENNEDLSTHIKGSLRRVPLSAIMKVLVGELEFKYLWANCEMEAQGPLDTIAKQTLKMGNCQIDGPYGEILLTNFSANFGKVDTLDLEINNVILDQVLVDKRDIFLSGVFSSYGVLSAHIGYEKGKWQGQGNLQTSEFIFSNNNLRDIQKVHVLPFEFSGENQAWRAVFGKVELEEGDFEGEVQVSHSKNGETSGRVSIHKIQLNPRIYKLVLNSEPTELRAYGQFSWSKGEVPKWSAMLATEQLKSEFYDLKLVKVKGSSLDSAKAEVKVTVGEGLIQANGPFLEWISPTYLDQKWDSESVQFSELSTHLKIFKNRQVEWNRGYARLKNGWQISSEGSRDQTKKVTAWLQWDRPDRKYLKWNYSGTFFKGDWVPATPWVLNWLGTHPEFLKENSSIVFSPASKGSLGEKINRAGKKAIDKVKGVLNPNKEEARD